VAISVFDLFKIGIGPSSSHTVGPMRAAHEFATELRHSGVLEHATRVCVELFGSLALTGRGHGTDKAVLLGLLGELPDQVDPNAVPVLVGNVLDSGVLPLLQLRNLPFIESRDLLFHRRESLAGHANGMRFTAFNDADEAVHQRVYYSIGGGAIVEEALLDAETGRTESVAVAHPFTSAQELLNRCAETDKGIADLILENECFWRSRDEVHSGLLRIWQVMRDCVARGLETEGQLPGGLDLNRRAPGLYTELKKKKGEQLIFPSMGGMSWVNLYALAVSEENAAGGRVVTAPTNGAAGIIPAVMHYFTRFLPGSNNEAVVRFMLTAGAIGALYVENASISGAEVGCQGEVGVACSMAAAGLTEVLGGTPAQVENAAEIAMEHNLGLTCDPVKGLVQVPCIERNAMAAVKAINAAHMAMEGDGSHFVSLDKVIKTMRITGRDMHKKYKETSEGGLAVNLVEC